MSAVGFQKFRAWQKGCGSGPSGVGCCPHWLFSSEGAEARGVAGWEVSNLGPSLLAGDQHSLGAGCFVPSENTRVCAGRASKLWRPRVA